MLDNMDVIFDDTLFRAPQANQEPAEGRQAPRKVKEEQRWRWEPPCCTCCRMVIIALFQDFVIFLDLINYNLIATLTDRSFDICMRE